MEVSAKMTKLMTNNTSCINSEIKVNGQKLETVTSLKNLGSVISDEDSRPVILSRIAQTTAALARFKPLWNARSTSLSSKIRLMHSLVTPIFLYASESYPHSRAPKKNTSHGNEIVPQDTIQNSYKDHVTNEEVRAKIQQAIGPHEDLTHVKRRTLQWYGHVFRLSGLAKTILEGTVKGERRQGGQRKRWEDNIREWTGLEFA